MLAPLLLAASLAGAQSDGFCPINLPLSEKRYALDSPECALLESLDVAARELAKSQKIDPDKYALRGVDPDPDYNAYFYTGGGKRAPGLVVTRGFLACHVNGDKAAAVAVIAHEVGHAVQHARGIKLARKDNSPEGVERLRRHEAQADQLSWDMLHRTELVSRRAYAWDGILKCIGASEYVSQHAHPSTAVRWIEAMRHYQRPSPREMRGAVGVVGAPQVNALLRDVSFNSSDREALSPQGRAPNEPRGAAVTNVASTDLLPAVGKTVQLDEGVFWYVPEEYSRYFSAAEILAYATREQIKPITISQGAAEGLGYLRQTRRWDLLPGVIRDRDSFTLPH